MQILLAFLAGGVLCVIAQLFINLTKATPARILVCYVCIGVLLYALGIYEPLLKIFGAGVSLPLIGFGGAIGRGVKEAISKDGIFGILSGGITATAQGITLSLALGLLASLISRGRPKKM